jgi:Rho termination factor, N-terminal domain
VAEESEKSLDEMTVTELRERATELEITGRSSMSKEDLIQSVRDAEEQTARMEANGHGNGSASEPESESASEWEPRATKPDSSDTSDASSESSDGEEDASDITAPSIGPNTTIEHVPPEERLDMDKISDVDAMGLDKRRQVGGQRYGASPAKQLAVYGGALAVIIALVIGAKLLTDELDQPPAVQEDSAPWAEGEQKKPAPIDFPRSTEQ